MSNESFDINQLLSDAFLNPDDFLNLEEAFNHKLQEYDISKRKAIGLLSIDSRTLDDTLQGTAKQPNVINLIKIANFLEISIDTVVQSVIKNQSAENIGSIEKAKNATFIAKNLDIKKLSKIGFFEDSENSDALINRFLTFFGFESIYQYEQNIVKPLLSKTKRSFADKMKSFWVASAIQCFKNINNPNEYNRESLKDIIVKIKPYCQDVEKGLFTVCKALYNVGVTVIVQNHLTLTQVRGGTFSVNGKPCIVLTDLNKKYTTIWETLIHELHHVLYDLDTIEDVGFHLTGEPDLFLIEERAEEFSREFFCGRSDYEYIKVHINEHFIVSRFARELEIDPSFIYSSYRQFQMLLHKRNYYAAFKEFFPDYTLAVKNLSPITWKENSITDVAKNLKSIFELNV